MLRIGGSRVEGFGDLKISENLGLGAKGIEVSETLGFRKLGFGLKGFSGSRLFARKGLQSSCSLGFRAFC